MARHEFEALFHVSSPSSSAASLISVSYTHLTKAHPTAEAIFKALEPTNPTMSLATVYKTLDSFSNAEIIQVLSIDGESLHYDYDTSFHPHIILSLIHI